MGSSPCLIINWSGARLLVVDHCPEQVFSGHPFSGPSMDPTDYLITFVLAPLLTAPYQMSALLDGNHRQPAKVQTSQFSFAEQITHLHISHTTYLGYTCRANDVLRGRCVFATAVAIDR